MRNRLVKMGRITPLLLAVLLTVVLWGVTIMRHRHNAHGIAQEALRKANPAMAARIESDVAALRQESVQASVENLIDMNMFSWPGPPAKSIVIEGGIPLRPDCDQETIDQILSNRRFRKVLADLARLDKHTASVLVSNQLALAVSQYLPLYGAKMSLLEKAPDTYTMPIEAGGGDVSYLKIKLPPEATYLTLEAAEALRNHPEFAHLPASLLTNIPITHTSNSPGVTYTNGQRIVMAGARLKVLSLVWLSGLLN